MILSQPTPELPVRDVVAAQEYYRDRFGFTIAWHNVEGRIGAVYHGDCAIFFRASEGEIHPATFWIYTEDVDAVAVDFAARGAEIVAPLADTAWGMRQVSVRDLHGNVFHFHRDL